MGTILENHTLHIINEDKTSDELTGVMIQVNDTESVFYVRTAKNCSIPPVISSFEGMRLLRNDEIIRGKKVYIKGDDGMGYLLTIVSNDFYRDEDTELAETEAYYYQERGELYVVER